jgi:GTPase SAR1 family protein
MSDVDYLLKILILGDSSVGKSCLLLKFCDDKFNLAHNPTIGKYFNKIINKASHIKFKKNFDWFKD